jgi:hypothetical protein
MSPNFGDTELTDGGHTYVYRFVPVMLTYREMLTTTLTTPADLEPVVQVMVVEFTTTTLPHVVPPIFTVDPATKPYPVIVTRWPPVVGPTFGEIDVTVGPGGVAEPLSATVEGLPTTLLAKLSDAGRLPLADGLKVMMTVHVPLAARVWLEQLSVTIEYSDALVPVSVTAPAPNARLAFPVLVTVTVCCADV